MNHLPLAFGLDASTVWVLIPLAALLIPVLALVMWHQQKMAALIHGKALMSDEEAQALRNEVASLRARLDQLELGTGSPPRELPR